ncbi:MAG: S1C family serine protease [Thermocrispum sp.]
MFAALSSSATLPVAGRAIPGEPGETTPMAHRAEPGNPGPDDAGDFGPTFVRVSSGVVPVTSVACGGGGTGTAFLIDDRTLVTAAHVVSDAVSVSAQVDGTPRIAQVVGIDESADLAVLEVDTAASGSPLPFADTSAEVSDHVAALGYPEGTALRLTEGQVVGVDQSVTVEGDQRHHVIEATASARRGNSGGPLINTDGEVVGVVIAVREDGPRSFAVEASEIRSRIGTMPQPPETSCEQPPLGPDDDDFGGFDAAALTEEVAATFVAYFEGINTGAYATAYQQLSPRLAGPDGFDAFADGVSTSYDFGFTVRAADLNQDSARVWLEFISLQAPAYGPEGEPCTEWSLEYRLVRAADGRFLIDRVSAHQGTPQHRPCG